MYTRTNTAKWLPKYNRWQIKVQKNGVRKTFTCSTKGRKGQIECNRKADEWLNNGLANPNTTVRELAKMFIREKGMYVGTSRYRNIKSYFRSRVLPYIGHMRVSELNEQNLQNVLNILYMKGYSYHTLNDTKAILCEFMKFARKNGVTRLTPENLFINKNAPRGTKNILQPSDIQILFSNDKTILKNAIVSDPFIHAYRMLVVTGLRRGELLGLKWSDVKESTIEIKRAVNEYQEVTEGKTINAQRTIPLTPICKEILDQIPHESEWIFGGNEVRPQYLLERYKIYAQLHKLTAQTIHELRHTFISLFDSELPLNTLKDVVGHSEEMRTVSQYGHIVSGEIEKAGDVINAKFSGIITSGLKVGFKK